jgi:hypothetical protein
MSLTRTLVSDRTGLLGATAGLLAQLPPEAIYGYLAVRTLIPILLILHATHHASPTQRITLVTTYLTGTTTRTGTTSRTGTASRRRTKNQ